jgi:hypothetical protein
LSGYHTNQDPAEVDLFALLPDADLFTEYPEKSNALVVVYRSFDLRRTLSGKKERLLFFLNLFSFHTRKSHQDLFVQCLENLTLMW